jgi:RHS repeat-associated protein
MKDSSGEIFHKTSSAPRISAYVQDDRDGLWRVFSYARLHISQTGLDLLGARYYNASLGRFLSKDPIEGGSANAYEYAGGDPINKVDPEGTYFFGVGLAYYYYLAYLLTCLFQGCPTARDIPAPFGSEPTVRYYPKRNSSTPTPAPPRFGDPSGFRRVEARWLDDSQHAQVRVRTTVDWGDVGEAAFTGVPFWGPAYQAWGCAKSGNQYNCGISVSAGLGMSFVPHWATLLAIPINAGADLLGQVFGGASLW